MDALECIRTRRSIRKYTDQYVSDELIDQIIDAGRWGPTAHNYRPTEYIVIRDPETKKKLSDFAIASHAKRVEGWTREQVELDMITLPKHLKEEESVVTGNWTSFYRFVKDVPVIIAVIANTRLPVPPDKADKAPTSFDGSYMKNPYHLFDTFMCMENCLLAAHALGLGSNVHMRCVWNSRKEVSKLLKLPDHYYVHSMIFIGYPAESPVVEKRPLEEIRHYEYFSNKVKPDGE